MLHVFLPLDCCEDARVAFNIDQSFKSISFGETLYDTFAMLPNAFWKIARDTNVKNAIRPISENIDPSRRFHFSILECRLRHGNAFVDGRDTPGHDDWFGSPGRV